MTNQGARKPTTRKPATVRKDDDGFANLDALLHRRSTSPGVVRLGGRDWEVRRDLTPAEVVEFWVLNEKITQPEDLPDAEKAAWVPGPVRALAMLMGDNDTALAFMALVDALPANLHLEIWRRTTRAAGLKLTMDDQGESSAS